MSSEFQITPDHGVPYPEQDITVTVCPQSEKDDPDWQGCSSGWGGAWIVIDGVRVFVGTWNLRRLANELLEAWVHAHDEETRYDPYTEKDRAEWAELRTELLGLAAKLRELRDAENEAEDGEMGPFLDE